MARIFQDGFEFGVPVNGRYTSEGNGGSFWTCFSNYSSSFLFIQADSSIKNSGNYSLLLNKQTNTEAFNWARTDLPNLTELYFRTEFYWSDGSSDKEQGIMSLRDGTSYIVELIRYNTDLRLYVLGSLVDTIEEKLPATTWIRIEIHLKMHSTEGIVEVKINGNNTLTYNGDTLGAYSNINRLYLGGLPLTSYSAYKFYFDDIAINDTMGTVNNSWCGKGSVLLLKPKADGTHTDWTPNSGTDHYPLVDDVPPDGDTSYVVTDTEDNIDSYDMEELIADLGVDSKSVVKAVQLCASARYEGSDAKLDSMIRIGATDEIVGEQVTLGSDYQLKQLKIFDTNPIAAEAWTLAAVDSLEAGIIHKDSSH